MSSLPNNPTVGALERALRDLKRDIDSLRGNMLTTAQPVRADLDMGGHRLLNLGGPAGGIGVASLAKSGSAALTGIVTLSAGSNVTLTQSGQNIAIAAAGGGTGDLLANGTIPLTADWDVGAYKITANQLASDVAIGTAPLVITSTTAVANLNADLLDGNHAAAFATAAHTHAGVYQPADADLDAWALITPAANVGTFLATPTGANLVAALTTAVPNLVLYTPQINNPAATFQYIVNSSAIAADRNVTLPLLAGDDEFVFKDFAQSLTNKKLGSLTTNGFVKTSGSDGTLGVDTSTYLTGNQSITLSGDVSGTGTTAITTAIGAGKVTLAMQANIAASTILGNNTVGAAAPIALSAADTRTLLGLVIGTNVQAYDADLTTWAGITPAANVGAFLATPSSANLAAAVTDETGTGALVFADSPVHTTQITAPIVYGSAAASGVLNLQGTTHATKGKVAFGSGTLSYYSQPDERWHFGGGAGITAWASGVVPQVEVASAAAASSSAEVAVANVGPNGYSASTLGLLNGTTLYRRGGMFYDQANGYVALGSFELPTIAALTTATSLTGAIVCTKDTARPEWYTTITGAAVSHPIALADDLYGATTTIAVGGGAGTLPVWTTATGTGAPVRAGGNPAFTSGLSVGATSNVMLDGGSNDTSLRKTAGSAMALRVGSADKFTIASTGVITITNTVGSYNGIATVDSGFPASVGHINGATQSATLGATTIYTPAATGYFRVNYYIERTTAATTSSSLTPVLTFTGGDSNVAQTMTLAANTTNSASTGSLGGSITIYARTGVAVALGITYASVGATAMVYNYRASVEAL